MLILAADIGNSKIRSQGSAVAGKVSDLKGNEETVVGESDKDSQNVEPSVKEKKNEVLPQSDEGVLEVGKTLMAIVEYKETPPLVEHAEMLVTSGKMVQSTTMLCK